MGWFYFRARLKFSVCVRVKVRVCVRVCVRIWFRVYVNSSWRGLT